MSNKMLIDASHPEETRVAVVRGNRIEDFDFESQEKKQLRGNIYLAKVTRVEPSLQAAFVDYGGNRHGFLAFSEIHPDYYQIPMADRQALLEAEAAEAQAMRDAEEAEDEEGNGDEQEVAADQEDEQPKKKPRRRRSRKKTDEQEEQSASSEDAVEKKSEDSTETENAKADNAETEESASEEEKPKPKRRTSRRKPAAKKAEANEETSEDKNADDTDENDDGDTPPESIAAVVELDSISEEVPEDDTDTGEDEVEESSEEETKKPRRRTSRRSKKAVVEDEEAVTASEEETKDDSDKEDGNAEGGDTPSEGSDDSEDEGSKGKSRRRSSRRRSSRSRKKAAEAEDNNETDDDDNGDNGSDVEQVGQEDALEEVPNPRRQRRHYKIQEVIKRRQILLVQVVKEERGNKGAALTTYLSLAGRYSVLMPNTARGGGISRKITNAADRKRLKGIASKLDVPQGMGVILRTAGASRTEAEINRDFEYLMRLWEQVRSLTLSSSAPCLVYEEGSLIKRSIRDLYDKDTGEILVSGETGFTEAKDFMSMLMPEHVKRVKAYKDNQSLFAKYGIESQLDRMMSPQVTLKSGGYLVINQTEALVAVDVNSGRSTREHSVEDTALQTNLEAAEEVARQLRLRDLAGLIVIDFIDMEEKRNNRSVEKKLKECLKNDRARIQVGRISHFGLMEMSRQRMRSSVLESTMEVCPHCAGLGYIRSDSAIALHVFRAIEEHVSKHNKFDAVVRTTRAIAFQILNHKRAALLELETKYGLRVIIEADPAIIGQEFAIEKGEPARGDNVAAAVGFQNEAAFDAMESELEEKEAGEKQRNRRARNRKDDKEKSEDNTSGSTSDGMDNPDDNDDEERSRKKRRRGKRGGRRRKNNEANQEENEAEQETSDDETSVSSENLDHNDVTPDPDAKPSPKKRRSSRSKSQEVAPGEEDKTSHALDDQNDASEAEEKPKKTTRKRVTQKAPVQEKVEKDPASQSDDSDEPKPEPPRPARRRTSRRSSVSEPTPVGDIESSDNTVDAQSATNEMVAEATLPEPEGDNSSTSQGGTETAEEKPKKGGWWNRGGGFFG